MYEFTSVINHTFLTSQNACFNLRYVCRLQFRIIQALTWFLSYSRNCTSKNARLSLRSQPSVDLNVMLVVVAMKVDKILMHMIEFMKDGMTLNMIQVMFAWIYYAE